MARTVVTVNGQTLLDDPLDHWHERPPTQFTDLINPQDPNSKPWMRAIMLALVEAVVSNQPTRIAAETHVHGWSLKVQQLP